MKLKAFSLMELSIVLIVIGLMIAAVVGGKDLIKMSEIRSAIAQVQELNASIKQFEITYQALPGDMNNATDFWSDVDNGNGDGEVDEESEQFLAAKHLSLAKLIDGEYTGKPASGKTYVPGENVIESKLKQNTAISLSCCGNTGTSLHFLNKIHIFGVENGNNMTGAVTPIEALWIDEKMDDGIPDTGRIGSQGLYNNNGSSGEGCFSGTGKTSKYLTNDANFKELKNCSVMFAYE